MVRRSAQASYERAPRLTSVESETRLVEKNAKKSGAHRQHQHLRESIRYAGGAERNGLSPAALLVRLASRLERLVFLLC